MILAILFAGHATAQTQTEGRPRWAVNVQGFITLSSPALSPDGATVYVGVERSGSGRVVALTAEGSRRWDAALAAPVDSSPAVGPDGTVYIGCVDGKLYALNPLNGATKWTVSAGGFVTSSPAIGSDGTIYVGSSAGRLHAITPAGLLRWSFQTGGGIDSSPAIAADGTIYFGSDDKSLYAITVNGTLKWRFQTGARIFASPAIGADGTVYIGSGDQKMYAVTPDGGLRWEYSTNGDIQSSPVLGADGTVYFASADGNFYALNPTGDDEHRVKWKTDIRASTASTAAVRGDGVIIVGADDDKVRALNPDNGSIRWEYSTLDDVESSPVVAPDGSVYVGSFDGFLYRLNGSGSPLSAYSSWPAFRGDISHNGRAVATSGSGRLANLSTRAQVAGGETLIAGFFVQGAGDENGRAYLMRGIGPALGQFGVAGMPDPRLRVFSGSVVLGSNDDWGTAIPSPVDTAAAVGAFALPDGSRDAAIVLGLPAGLYTAHVDSSDARGGVVLVEAYDAFGGNPVARLVNLSTRGRVGVNENALFAGVVVSGSARTRLLLRGVGPGLSQFGVSGVLARPTLSLFSGPAGGAAVRANSGWTTDGYKFDLEVAARAVSAFPLADGSADCAMMVVVDPGAYTIRISGVGGTTGEALVEIYVLP